MRKADLENLSRAVTNLIDGIAAASGESRWYIARLVGTEAEDIYTAEYRKSRAELNKASSEGVSRT